MAGIGSVQNLMKEENVVVARWRGGAVRALGPQRSDEAGSGGWRAQDRCDVLEVQGSVEWLVPDVGAGEVPCAFQVHVQPLLSSVSRCNPS